MNISFDPVQDIKERISVEQLLGEYLNLQRAGVNLKALCPFHAEKTPSFMVSPERRSWHCFGCNKGGDIFTFIMEIEGLSFREALEHLAKKAGVELPKKAFDQEKSKRANRLYEINKATQDFYRKCLAQESAEAKNAQAELVRRKVDKLTQDLFCIGFAPSGWEHLASYLSNKGFKEQDMLAAGVVVARRGSPGVYDRFRNRLMFPLVDVMDRVLGFSARALDPKEKMGKYINSPESEIYHKSNFLFALNHAKTEIRKRNFAILVEGQMDAISSHRVGVKNTVATSGTALTQEHLKILKRYTNNLILAFDVDLAGASATKRGIDLALAQGFNVKVAQMPHDVDPDDLCRTQPKKWGEAINKSQAIIDYYIRQSIADKDLSKVENKKAVAKIVLPEIARLNDNVEQTHYLQRIGKLLAVDEQVLRQALKKVSYKKVTIANKSDVAIQQNNPTQIADPFLKKIARLLALRLRLDKIEPELIAPLDLLNQTITKKVKDLLIASFSEKDLIRKLPEIKEGLERLVDLELFALDKERAQEDKRQLEIEFKDLIIITTKEGLRRELTELHKKAALAQNDPQITTEFVAKTRELAKLEEPDNL